MPQFILKVCGSRFLLEPHNTRWALLAMPAGGCDLRPQRPGYSACDQQTCRCLTFLQPLLGSVELVNHFSGAGPSCCLECSSVCVCDWCRRYPSEPPSASRDVECSLLLHGEEKPSFVSSTRPCDLWPVHVLWKYLRESDADGFRPINIQCFRLSLVLASFLSLSHLIFSFYSTASFIFSTLSLTLLINSSFKVYSGLR